MTGFIVTIFLIWRGCLFLAEKLGLFFLVQREGFIGPSPWANFDGLHYLSIAQGGYFQYEQAFFPLFPVLIKKLAFIFRGELLPSAFLIVYLSLFGSLFLFWKLVRIDYTQSVARWSIVFLLFFPTAFFLVSVYTESLFLMLILGSFYALRKKKWYLASVLGGLASGTRLVGLFLLPALLWEWFQENKSQHLFSRRLLAALFIPLGLLIYMFYSRQTYGDPLMFFHSQPAFGANRSGQEIIFLPQVFFRYFKILSQVPITQYDFWLAAVELIFFLGALVLLIASWQKLRKSYVLFSLLAIIAPTLTGTLSSMPRYLLVAFPLFIFLGQIKRKTIKLILLSLFFLGLIIMSVFFTRGYFIA